MSRTYRLRRLPQPEGGERARLFVDSSVRAATNRAEEDFLAQLAHKELKLPCVLKGGKRSRNKGWGKSHSRCLPREVNLLLWTLRPGRYWKLGWIRTLSKFSHPYLGYGLAMVPSKTKRESRREVYRLVRQAAKNNLRLRLSRGADKRLAASTDRDWEEMDFPDLRAELAGEAWRLT